MLALNEEAALEKVIEEVLAAVRPALDDFELILVNDGSSDGTGVIMERFAAREPERIRAVHNERNIGIGASFKRGLDLARYEYVEQLCGDGGVPADQLPAILAQVGTTDLVLPYMTNLPAIKTPFRLFTSRGYTVLLNILFGLDIKYYNGLPVHRRDLLLGMPFSSNGFVYSAEIVLRQIHMGASYVQVGVLGHAGHTKSSALRFRSMMDVFKSVARLLWGVRTWPRQRPSRLTPQPE